MSLFVVGLNHQTAPVALRERVAFSPAQLPRALLDLCAVAQLPEAMILSTCNRTEIYTIANDSAAIIDWLVSSRCLRPDQLIPHLYSHQHLAVAKHLAEVASGLNSMLLGEPQIFGQVKAAYQATKKTGTLGRRLQHLCQHSFYVTKKIRTETAIGQKPISIAFSAVSLVKRIFAEPAHCQVVLLGAGETIASVAEHLAALGMRQMRFVNRTLSRAQTLATRWQGEAFALAALDSVLASADILIAATDSPELLVQAKSLANARQQQRRKPMLLIDLAVPRNIDPAIGQQSDCYLYGLDDVHSLIQDTLVCRREAAMQAHAIIECETADFSKKLQRLALSPQIQALYQQAGECRDQQLKLAVQQVQNGMAIEAVLHQLAHRLSQQLIHIPVTMLRDQT